MKLVPSPPGRYVGGTAVMDGADLMALDPAALESVRGSRIAMIFQNPRAALNPSFTIRTQLVETLRRHHRALSHAEAEETAASMLREVSSATTMSTPSRWTSSQWKPHFGPASASASNPKAAISNSARQPRRR